MARPVSICDEDLLGAARRVFLERGARATTAEIAAAAGVSEGSIFKRYKSKSDLFEAALQEIVNREPDFLRQLEASVGKGDVRENLLALGQNLLSYFEEVVPLILLAWSNPGPDGVPPVLSGPKPMPIRLLSAIHVHFSAEVAAGRLAPRSPEVLARTFVGAIHNYVVFRRLFASSARATMPEREFLHGLVQALWEGMDPSLAAPKPRATKGKGRA